MFYLSEDPAFCSLLSCTGLEFQFEYQNQVLKCVCGEAGTEQVEAEYQLLLFLLVCLVAISVLVYDQMWKMKNVEIQVCNKNWSKLT